MAFFDVTDPMGRRQLDLKGEILTFGRLRSCSLQLRDHACSRSHFEIRVKPDGLWLRDLGSRNRTQLNGKAVAAETKLNPGDMIKAGRSTLVFEPQDATRLAPVISAKGPEMKGSTVSAQATKSAVPGTPGAVPVKAKPSVPPAPGGKPAAKTSAQPSVPPPAQPAAKPAAARKGGKPESVDDATRLAPATPVPSPHKPSAAVEKLARSEGAGVPKATPVLPVPASPAPRPVPKSVPEPVKPFVPGPPRSAEDLAKDFAGGGDPLPAGKLEETPSAGAPPAAPVKAPEPESPPVSKPPVPAPPPATVPGVEAPAPALDPDTPPALKALPREDEKDPT